jgi:hypothetical protein
MMTGRLNSLTIWIHILLNIYINIYIVVIADILKKVVIKKWQ